MRSRRAIWAAGWLFAAHETLLHSQANAVLEQGGLFGQDRVQDLLLVPGSDRSGFIPTISTMIYDKFGRPAAVSMLEMLTSRHDPRVIGALLDRLKPNTFRLLLQPADEEHPGLTDGIRVIMSMVSVSNPELQWRMIDTLIRTGAMDRIVREMLVTVSDRAGKRTAIRKWLVENPTDAVQFIRERETAIRTFTRLLSNCQFREKLQNDFDSCFLDPDAIRRIIKDDDYPDAALIALLPKSAVGAIGRRNAAKARSIFLSSLPDDDPRRALLTSKNETKGSVMLSFVMPQYEDGSQITVERMKLAGSLGVISSAVAMVIGRRSGSAMRNLLRAGLGSSLFVLWNDLFINWDRFFSREQFPVFDRSTEQGVSSDAVWSTLCCCAHYIGNLGLFAAFPGAFLPYMAISSSHFTGEIYALSLLFGAAPPPHSPKIWIRPAPSGDV